MLKITGLKKKYKNFEVLKGLDMNLGKGDVYGFLGKNGCGKTTTMNIICNIISKDEGKIEFVGAAKPKIGYLTESPALYGFMNGYEYLKYIAACATSANGGKYAGDADKRIMEVLAVTGMIEGSKRKIKGYSRGMNQRLGIAAAMFDNPELLILDEPTSALDPEGRLEVMNIINSLKNSGVTIILCTHIITDVERVANKIGVMKNGLIVEEGSIDEIMAKYKGQSSSDITVKLSNPNGEVGAMLRMLPSVNASSYNEVSGVAVLGSANPDMLYDEIIGLIYEKRVKVAQLTSQNVTLEDVYFTITGMKGGAA